MMMFFQPESSSSLGKPPLIPRRTYKKRHTAPPQRRTHRAVHTDSDLAHQTADISQESVHFNGVLTNTKQEFESVNIASPTKCSDMSQASKRPDNLLPKQPANITHDSVRARHNIVAKPSTDIGQECIESVNVVLPKKCSNISEHESNHVHSVLTEQSTDTGQGSERDNRSVLKQYSDILQESQLSVLEESGNDRMENRSATKNSSTQSDKYAVKDDLAVSLSHTALLMKVGSYAPSHYATTKDIYSLYTTQYSSKRQQFSHAAGFLETKTNLSNQPTCFDTRSIGANCNSHLQTPTAADIHKCSSPCQPVTKTTEDTSQTHSQLPSHTENAPEEGTTMEESTLEDPEILVVTPGSSLKASKSLPDLVTVQDAPWMLDDDVAGEGCYDNSDVTARGHQARDRASCCSNDSYSRSLSSRDFDLTALSRTPRRSRAHPDLRHLTDAILETPPHCARVNTSAHTPTPPPLLHFTDSDPNSSLDTLVMSVSSSQTSTSARRGRRDLQVSLTDTGVNDLEVIKGNVVKYKDKGYIASPCIKRTKNPGFNGIGVNDLWIGDHVMNGSCESYSGPENSSSEDAYLSNKYEEMVLNSSSQNINISKLDNGYTVVMKTSTGTVPSLKGIPTSRNSPTLRNGPQQNTPILANGSTLKNGPILKNGAVMRNDPILSNDLTFRNNPTLRNSQTLRNSPTLRNSSLLRNEAARRSGPQLYRLQQESRGSPGAGSFSSKRRRKKEWYEEDDEEEGEGEAVGEEEGEEEEEEEEAQEKEAYEGGEAAEVEDNVKVEEVLDRDGTVEDAEEEEEEAIGYFGQHRIYRHSDRWRPTYTQYDNALPSSVRPLLYSLDDYQPRALPPETAPPPIYSLQQGSHRHSTGGQYFARSRSLANLPASFSSRSVDSSDHVQEANRKWQIQANTDDTVPTEPARGRGYQRSGSVDGKRHWRNKRTSKSGSAWTGDEPSSDSVTARRDSGLSHHSDRPQSCSATPQLYYVTPPKSMAVPAATEGRLERSGSGRGGSFSRLARRLSQRERRSDRERAAGGAEAPTSGSESSKKTLRQRSVSLDCGDTRRVLADGSPANHLSAPGAGVGGCRVGALPASPSMPSRMNHLRGLSLSSPGSPRAGSISRSDTGGKQGKTDKRKRSQQDLQELFAAVESQDQDQVKRILDTCLLDVNALNSDDLTPLDIAVFMNHVPMARLLLAHGARENPQFVKGGEGAVLKLSSLIRDAEEQLQQRQQRHLDAVAANSSASQLKENEKSLNHWEYRLKFYKRMKKGYDSARPPEAPSCVRLSVASPSSVQLHFESPASHNGAVVTRYRVEWSCYAGFEPLGGELLIEDPARAHCVIPNLAQGNLYYVRIRAWNVKGWSEAAPATPSCVTTTWWREVDDVCERMAGKLKLLSTLFTNMRNARSPEAAAIKDQCQNSPMPSRKSNVRKSIKNLFAGAPKFQKYLERGVFLACVVCCEDRLLVTSEDQLPIVEVDDSYSAASFNSSFHWLMKIACTWEDVKSLRQDLDRIPSSNTFHLRGKLLTAASQLQSALGINDLGRLYHSPIKDANGSLVLATVTSVRDTKCVSTANLKWTSQAKLLKRIATGESFAAPEMLLQNTQSMLSYSEACRRTLPRGLYVGYLKLSSSVDLIRIMVPEDMPSVLPYVLVRDTPHVTREEWKCVRALSQQQQTTTSIPALTPQLCEFRSQLSAACQSLLEQLGVSAADAPVHRLYDHELIELSEDVAILLLLPPVDSVCNVPGTTQQLTDRPGYLTVPIQVFEIVHMSAYQHDFISRYCRLSSILEMDSYLAQQAQREAFSSEELAVAKQRVETLASLSKPLEEAWRGVRWTMDIIAHARDKSVPGGLSLATLLAQPTVTSQENGGAPTSGAMERSEAVSSTCSDPGYHSDVSSSLMDNSIDTGAYIGPEGSESPNSITLNRRLNHSSHMRLHKQRQHLPQHHLQRSSPALECECELLTPRSNQGQTTADDSLCEACQRLQRSAPNRLSGRGLEHNASQNFPSPNTHKAHSKPMHSIITIRAAYETGLSLGASVKLKITSGVTSRDVINLVVDDLNRKVLDGRYVYGKERLTEFCLVAVIGARERVLRDDFQLLTLQQPWTQGQLFVRMHSDVLAALQLESGQITSV